MYIDPKEKKEGEEGGEEAAEGTKPADGETAQKADTDTEEKE